MRRIWAAVLIGGAALAAAAAVWAMLAQPLMQDAPAPPVRAEEEPVRNPTVFVGSSDPAGSPTQAAEAAIPTPAPAAEAAVLASTATPAPVPPTVPTPAASSTPPTTQAPRAGVSPPPSTPRATTPSAPPPAPTPTATTAGASRPAPPLASAAAVPPNPPATSALGRCTAPRSPSAPPTTRAPSEDELSAFASAVERYDGEAAGYRRCLDAIFGDASQPEAVRRTALSASNDSAQAVNALWDAYDAATQRYREEQTRLAREAAERERQDRPALP